MSGTISSARLPRWPVQRSRVGSVSSVAITEDSYAEQPTLEWLGEQGWEIVRGVDIAPGAVVAERDRWEEVLLVDRLRSTVKDLNPDLPVHVIQSAVDRVRETASPTPILDHQAFHELLIAGAPVTFTDDAGEERSLRAKLVDWDQPVRNDFAAVSQFTVINGQKNRRPDVLLFVNGLPLAQVELKNPASAQATAESAARQVTHYVETIPQLYRFVEFVLVSDLIEARAGTITTPAEHFAEWRSMDAAEEEGRSRLEVAIHGLFGPERFLDLVRNFSLFETDGAKTLKLMAKYHQVEAVNRAIDTTWQAMQEDGRAGVVWHSQGSGKSYSMVFYVSKLRRDPRFETPTVVAVTDRLDLDQQLWEQFAAQAGLATVVKRAESISELHDLLNVPADDIVFTTIQKFQPETPGERMPVISERRNVIVIADEAHRSEYGEYAQNITVALPYATRIGFTGTPIETRDRSTRLVFGDYISIYRMNRAIEDGTTVPIYYENRRIPLKIDDPSLLKQVEEVVERENDEAKLKLVSSWARLEQVAGAPERLETLANDIADHYGRRAEILPGKGMVVGMSRRICAELTGLLKERLGDQTVTCVISASAGDDPAISKWRRSSVESKQVEADFKDPDDPLKMVVVRDMWLTGFDAPPLHTIYIDKPMRDHGLLQAITRVNRVFRDKPGGLVVDYIGIGEDLRASLSAYSEDVAEEAMVTLDDAIAKLREKHDMVKEFFHGLDYQRRHEMSAAQRATLFAIAYDRVVEYEPERKRYLTECALLVRWFKLVNPNHAAIEIAGDVEFFAGIALAITKRPDRAGDPSDAACQAVKQFFSEGLAAGEVIDVFALAGEERPEISILSDEFLDRLLRDGEHPHMRIDILKKLLNEEIRVRERTNNMQAKLFGDAMQDVLARYELRQLTSAEVIERLVELAKKISDARRRHEALGLTVEEAAFYDAVAGSTDHWEPDPDVAAIARDLVKNIKADLSVDWADHEATEAAIRAKIKRLLRRHQFSASPAAGGRPLDPVADLILEQARTLYRYWPDRFNAELPV
jgi:type I restriction enzyme, R subunit